MAKEDVKKEDVKKEDVKDEEQKEDVLPGINPKWLDGFVFRGAIPKEVEENGRKKMKYIPFERPLKPEDVMSFRDYGATVVIATKDGMKYTVAKKGK